MKEEFSAIHWKAIDIMLHFLTSYAREQIYSHLTNIKSKEMNRLLQKNPCVFI